VSGDDVAFDELAGRLGDERLTLLDVRTEAEYAGLTGSPCDPRQGHIPGAVNVELQELASLGPDGLRARLGPPEATDVVAYCHSGSRSALAVQVLRAAGYQARNYRGSWHEWSRLSEE
jgi:thiosulfate/3-mercaptopyruvate sulfurtransferase